VLAALTARFHMVDSQLLGLLAAVLARETIADEDLEACQPTLMERTTNVAGQSNDRGKRERGLDGVHDSPSVLNHLCFPAEHQDQGATSTTDIVGLKPLIQY
jgi:hypothetical protein